MTAWNAVRLTSWNRHSVDPLFASRSPKTLEVEAVLAGRTAGALYVDRPSAPRTAALNVGVGWHVVGRPSPDFLRVINRLLPRDTYSVLVLPDDQADAWLPTLTEDLYFVRARSRYAVRTQAVVPEPPCPDGYRVEAVDQVLLEREVEGIEGIREEILGTWHSLDAFLTDGFGFVVLSESCIVGYSMTDYVCGDTCEIGVFVDERHRLKGLGSLVATRTANEAFARGLRSVGWMSWACNHGSVAVSLNAGFSDVCEYDIHINHWPAENPSDLTQEEFQTFAAEYERQFEERSPTGSGYPHIVAATAWALAGSGQNCRAQLRNAIEMGWLTSVAQLKALWPELFTAPDLQERKPWADLLALLE